MSENIEDIAVERAAYSGQRWRELDEDMREYYRRLVKADRARAEAMKREEQAPPFMKMSDWL